MTKLLSLLALIPGILCANSTDSLVSYWALEDNLNDTAAAGSSTDNGSWIGAADYDPGKFGQAIEAKGNTYVSVPDSADLRGSSSTISISTWFRVVTFDTNWQALIAKGENSNWRLARRGSTSEMAYAGGSGDISGGSVNDGAWHHILGVSEAGIETRLYIDGVLIETGSAPNINDSGSEMFIGNNPGSPGRGWKGLIDDVGIFNSALNDHQAAAIYELGNNSTYLYSLDQINELFKLGQCPAGTTALINNQGWEAVSADPNDGRFYVQLADTGSGVVGSNGPTINFFTTPHTSVPAGTPLTFTWDVDPSATLLILAPGVGNVTGTTSYTFDPGPSVDTEYKLSAVGPTGTNTRIVNVTVTDQPIIEQFNATPPLLSAGESTTLEWQTYNTTSATLDGTPVALNGTSVVSPSSTTSYTLAVTNANGSTTKTITVPVVIPGEPIITEFLAGNNGTLLDEDGDASDWIQLTNETTTTTTINGNYFLTDDPADLQKWTIPNQTIAPGASVRYFATGKIGTTEPHANFSLKTEGEYLALVKVDGGITTILSEFNDYPNQFLDISYGIFPDLLTYGYFATPTPNGPNTGVTYLDYVRDTSFSVNRGFYTSTQSVAITSSTTDAEIYYTTDGSEPSATNGTLYTAPISIATTTTLRAIGTKTDFLPTNIDTHTYIFTADVVSQPTNPPGWPTGSVNGQIMDYAMDPGSAVSSSEAEIIEALESIPTWSIVTDQGNLTDPATGIYVRPGNRGIAWERPASLEMILPPGYVSPDGLTTGFQSDLGIRIRGGASRSTSNPKHAFRMFFRRDYGNRSLNFPLFGPSGTDQFGGIDIRTAQNYSWSFKSPGNVNGNNDNSNKNTFMREVFARDTQRDLGETHTRSRYIHLYLNGVYWGLFMTQERAEAEFAEQYLGGNDNDYDTIKSAGSSAGYSTEATDGNNADWMAGYNLAINVSKASGTNNSDYFAIQGFNSSGIPDPLVPTHIDVENLIKYIMVVFYNGSFDAPLSTFIGASNNWFAVRNRETDDRGWSFFAHDMEHSLGSYATSRQDRTGPFWFGSTADQEGFDKSNPQYIHQYLANNLEYRMKFADIIHREFFNDGVYTNQAVLARFGEREATVDQVIDAEAARWGDSKSSSNPLDRTEWAAAVNQLKNWTTDRNLEVLAQLKIDDLYPDTEAPVFSQHGGQINPGFTLMMNNTNGSGTVYYTTDGSDPREVGGAISASASSGSSVILNSASLVQARVRINSTTWSALTSAEFATAGAPGPGDLVISEINYHPSDPTLAEQTAGFANDDDFEFIELRNTSANPIDLTDVTLANEVIFDFATISDPNDRILGSGQTIVIARRIDGFSERYPAIPVFGPWDGQLSNNTGTVDVLLNGSTLLFSLTYIDDSGWPESADGDGYTLVLVDSTMPNDPNSWRLSKTLLGNPNASDTELFTGLPNGDDNNNGINNLLEAVLRDGSGTYVHPTVALATYDLGDGPKEYLTLSLQRYLPVDNAVLTVEHATNLLGWTSADVQKISSVPLGDGTVTEVYRLMTPITSDPKDFMRVKVTLN
ncbi:MAG: LamG-like jellyroll fold domain-containing protein [Verrucomicrobiaceae bacterium]